MIEFRVAWTSNDTVEVAARPVYSLKEAERHKIYVESMPSTGDVRIQYREWRDLEDAEVSSV